MMSAFEQINNLQLSVFHFAYESLIGQPIVQYQFKKWFHENIRIEVLIPIQLGLLYNVEEESIKTVSASLLLAAFAMRILNDRKDKSAQSAFYSTSHPLYLLAVCQKTIIESKLEDSIKLLIVKEYINTIHLINSSELKLQNDFLNIEDYQVSVEGKTASAYILLFKTVSFLSDEMDDMFSLWEGFAYHFAMMMQLRNDYNGIYIESEYNDLDYQRYTWPIVLALSQSSEQSIKLKKLLFINSQNKNEKIKDVLIELNIPNEMKEMFSAHFIKAKYFLNDINYIKPIQFFLDLLHASMKDFDSIFINKKSHVIKSNLVTNHSTSLELRDLLRN